MQTAIAMLRTTFLASIVLLPASALQAGVRPKHDEDALKGRYDAFVEALDDKRVAEDYPKAVRKLDSTDPQTLIAGIKTLAATGEVEVIPWLVP